LRNNWQTVWNDVI